MHMTGGNNRGRGNVCYGCKEGRCAAVYVALIHMIVVVGGGVLFPVPAGKYILNEINNGSAIQNRLVHPSQACFKVKDKRCAG